MDKHILQLIIPLVLFQVKADEIQHPSVPKLEPNNISKIKLLEPAGMDTFYRNVHVNRLTIVLNKEKFNFDPWKLKLSSLTKFEEEATKDSRIFFLIRQIKNEIKSLEVHTWDSIIPQTVASSPDRTLPCSLKIEIFNTIVQNNGLNRFQNIISIMGPSIADANKEKEFFNTLQDALGQLRAFNLKLKQEYKFYEYLIKNQQSRPFLESLRDQFKDLSCLKEFKTDTLYIPQLISATQHDLIVKCDMTIYQFSNPIMINKYIYTPINGFQLNNMNDRTVHKIGNSLIILSKDNKMPFHSFTRFKSFSENCKNALESNDLLLARHPCDMKKAKTSEFFRFRPDGIQIFLDKIKLEYPHPLKGYDTAIIHQNSISMTTTFGTGTFYLHNSEIGLSLPQSKQWEMDQWDNIDELFLLFLFALFPFPLIPFIYKMFKNKKKARHQKILTQERNKSLLLLNTSYPNKILKNKRKTKWHKLSRQRLPPSI